jgi:hypothetical protein
LKRKQSNGKELMSWCSPCMLSIAAYCEGWTRWLPWGLDLAFSLIDPQHLEGGWPTVHPQKVATE